MTESKYHTPIYKEGDRVTIVIESDYVYGTVKDWLKGIQHYAVKCNEAIFFVKPEQIVDSLVKDDNPNRTFAIKGSRTDF